MKQKNIKSAMLMFIFFQLCINCSWLEESVRSDEQPHQITKFPNIRNLLGIREWFKKRGTDSSIDIDNDDSDIFEDCNDFERLSFVPNCLLDVVIEQTKYTETIKTLENILQDLENSEMSYIREIQETEDVPTSFSTKLEEINGQKHATIRDIRDLNMLPVLKLETSGNNKLPVYQLHHTKELAFEHKEIACGPYMIAFALSVHEILHYNEPMNFLWKKAIEECSPKYFQPTDHTLEIFDIVERINQHKQDNGINTFTYVFLNYDKTSKNITLIDPAQFEENANPDKSEEAVQEEIKQKLRKRLAKEIIYFFYRIGQNGNGMGHWSLFACTKQNLEQPGIYYIDNMNNFIETTSQTAEYVREIFNQD